jgi:hypothetical protein
MMRVVGWFICAAIAVNFILFVLMFIPAFSGIGPEPGLADRIWGNYRLGGWRADVVWVVISTVAILMLGLAYAKSPSVKGSRAHKVVVTSCAVWLGCCVVYAGYVVIHMMG